MKTIKTQKGEFLFVEVPDYAYDFVEITNQSEIPYKTAIQYYTKCLVTGYPQGESVTIGLKFEIISTTKDITEEQAGSVVDKYNNSSYRDYSIDKIGAYWMPDIETNDIFLTAKESLQSLIQANGLGVRKNYLILKVNAE